MLCWLVSLWAKPVLLCTKKTRGTGRQPHVASGWLETDNRHQLLILRFSGYQTNQWTRVRVLKPEAFQEALRNFIA